MDIQFDLRMREAFDNAIKLGLWKGTPAARNPAEYWGAGVEAYFEAAGRGFPPVGIPRPITTREALQTYDINLFNIVDETMLYDGHQDWRYQAR